MNAQEEKNVQPETNDKQVKPVKRVLRATDLRHTPGIAVKTDVKAGMKQWRP
jgi:hypothetical protein